MPTPPKPDLSRDLNKDGIVDSADDPSKDLDHNGIINGADARGNDINGDSIIDTTDDVMKSVMKQVQSVGTSLGWSKEEEGWQRPENSNSNSNDLKQEQKYKGPKLSL